MRRSVLDRMPSWRQKQAREKARAQARRWKAENPDKVKAWLANNKLKLAAYSRKYRAKKAAELELTRRRSEWPTSDRTHGEPSSP